MAAAASDTKQITGNTGGGGGGSDGAVKRVFRVLFPLPDTGFDTTECAVAWHLLTAAGHDCIFATEQGTNGPPPTCDPKLLTGVIFGQLGADPEPITFYKQMCADPKYRKPVAWCDLVPSQYDGVWLSGGHAPEMRQYLGSKILQKKMSEFWQLARPVAAICHGPIVLARTKDASDLGSDEHHQNQKQKRSVLHSKRTMCLPKYMERAAYFATAWWLGQYYRTYPQYVEDEIKSVLADPERQYVCGPKACCGWGAPPKGTSTDDTHARCEVDEWYASARWPGDAYLLAKTFIKLLHKYRSTAVDATAGAAGAAGTDVKLSK